MAITRISRSFKDISLSFKRHPVTNDIAVLKNADAIIGNSSTGIREAPVYGVPTINIGSRQMNRFNYESIINVSENRENIVEKLSALPAPFPPSYPRHPHSCFG